MKYFLYTLSSKITGLPINAIRFDYAVNGYNPNHRLCDSKFLWRHFQNDEINIIIVHGNVIEIDII